MKLLNFRLDTATDMDAPPPRSSADSGSGPATSESSVSAAPPPSDQMRVAGSGRRKVALPPGRSQLDWIRNSKALPKRHLALYTLKEVRQHRTRADAWMAINGIVYDVTPYIEYHPGGIDMMMAGAGKDASKLFEKYHAWVNPEFMLESCLIGQLDGRGGSGGDVSDGSSDEE